jgi:hypothetical protein
MPFLLDTDTCIYALENFLRPVAIVEFTSEDALYENWVG